MTPATATTQRPASAVSDASTRIDARANSQACFVAAESRVVVNSWMGGFAGRTSQHGTEIWNLRDDLGVRHEMYTFCDVQPITSALARARLPLAGEARVQLDVLRQRRFAAIGEA